MSGFENEFVILIWNFEHIADKDKMEKNYSTCIGI